MTELRWTPFYSLFKREVSRFIKVIYQTLATPLISTLLYLVIFGVSIGKQIPEINNFPYLAFLIPGLAMMTTLRNSFENATGSVVTSKFCGELEDLKIVPLSPTQICWANGLGALARGMIVGLLTLGIGMLFYWYVIGAALPIAHPFYLLFFMLAAGFAFGNLGLAIAMLSTSFEQVAAFGTFVLLPLIYLGGVFFSLEHLHPIWQTISYLNPLLYLVNGMRYSVLGFSDVPITTSLAVTLATLIAFNLLALYSLKKGSYNRW